MLNVSHSAGMSDCNASVHRCQCPTPPIVEAATVWLSQIEMALKTSIPREKQNPGVERP